MNTAIDDYRAGADILKHAIAGLTREQLLAHPVPGTWSIQQIVTHLTDCEQVFADRIKRIIAEEKPQLLSFDENRWMTHLSVDNRPADESAELLSLTRRQIYTILAELPPTSLSRVGVHSQLGEMTLLAILERANWHLDHHLTFLRNKRAMVGSRSVSSSTH